MKLTAATAVAAVYGRDKKSLPVARGGATYCIASTINDRREPLKVAISPLKEVFSVSLNRLDSMCSSLSQGLQWPEVGTGDSGVIVVCYVDARFIMALDNSTYDLWHLDFVINHLLYAHNAWS